MVWSQDIMQLFAFGGNDNDSACKIHLLLYLSALGNLMARAWRYRTWGAWETADCVRRWQNLRLIAIGGRHDHGHGYEKWYFRFAIITRLVGKDIRNRGSKTSTVRSLVWGLDEPRLKMGHRRISSGRVAQDECSDKWSHHDPNKVTTSVRVWRWGWGRNGNRHHRY
jgi:hypothetical protein